MVYRNDPVHDRYNRDPVFRSLVEMLLAHLYRYEFSPTEMREAAMLASVMFEERRLVPVHYAKLKGGG